MCASFNSNEEWLVFDVWFLFIPRPWISIELRGSRTFRWSSLHIRIFTSGFNFPLYVLYPFWVCPTKIFPKYALFAPLRNFPLLYLPQVWYILSDFVAHPSKCLTSISPHCGVFSDPSMHAVVEVFYLFRRHLNILKYSTSFVDVYRVAGKYTPK